MQLSKRSIRADIANKKKGGWLFLKIKKGKK